jgi:hypothetical protein
MGGDWNLYATTNGISFIGAEHLVNIVHMWLSIFQCKVMSTGGSLDG